MIKITRARPVHDFVIEITFSDGTMGNCDLAPLFARDTQLTRPWSDPKYFASFFLELGALAWPNGLELSAESLRRQLEARNALRPSDRVA